MSIPGTPSYIQHPPVGSAYDQFASQEPLGAGRGQMVGNNLNWLQQVNQFRVLATFQGFYAITIGGNANYAFNFPPGCADIQWNSVNGRYAKTTAKGGNACLGQKFLWPMFGTPNLPRLYFSSRFRLNGVGTVAGLYVVAMAGDSPSPQTATQGVSILATTGTYGNAWNNFNATLPFIIPGSSAPNRADNTVAATQAETVALHTVSIFVGAAVQPGSNLSVDWIGMTVYAEPA